MDTKQTEIQTTVDSDEQLRFKGKYTQAIGRRKRAVAIVNIYKKGSGHLAVNSIKLGSYFTVEQSAIVRQPLKQAGLSKDVNVSILARGGGKRSQAEAVRHGIAQALIEIDEAHRAAFKAKGWLTRDARKKERKKPGLKKARRAPQWSKR